LPAISESSARHKSQTPTLDHPDVNNPHIVLTYLRKSLFHTVHPDLRTAIKAPKSIHLFTDEILIPWQLLLGEEKFYISGLNQIIKNLWEIIKEKQNSKITIKDRTYVLSLLIQCYSRRIGMLVCGPEIKMNAKKHMDNIQLRERVPSTF
jgi:hypothetical protein